MPLLPALVVIVGLCIGVSAVWLLGPPAEKPMPDVYVSLQGDTVQIGTMESGWGPSSVRGSALVSDVATLLVPIPDATNRELIVDIEMIGERKNNAPPVRIQLSANETVLGVFDLEATRVQRLLLPASAIDPQAPIIFKFESSTTPTEPVLIRSLTLRDIATLQDVAGRLDLCSGDQVRGWAAASDGPAPVAIRRNGTPTELILRPTVRPDLPAAGYPADAGFDFRLVDPIQQGEKVEVLLPGGKVLSGDQCKP